MRAVLKLLVFAAQLSLFVLHAMLARAIIRNEADRRRYAAKNLARYCRWYMVAFNLKVEVRGFEKLADDPRHFMIIANHMSYLDVMVIASRLPSLFVTSVEIENTPLLGTVCRAGGSYFVERRNRTKLAQELDSLGQVLKDGVNLVIFPEGTSSDGEGVLPFKKSLFASAVRASTPVLPLCLRYLSANGKPLDPVTRDALCYYGEMTFFAHFFRFLKLRSARIELLVLDPLDVSSESCRKELADLAHARISQAFASGF